MTVDNHSRTENDLFVRNRSKEERQVGDNLVVSPSTSEDYVTKNLSLLGNSIWFVYLSIDMSKHQPLANSLR
jgi:hypothetical protein